MNEIVYLGRRTLRDGKTGIAVIALDYMNKITIAHAGDIGSQWQKLAEKIDQAASIFDGKKSGFDVVGGIYEPTQLEFDASGQRVTSLATSRPKFIRKQHDVDLLGAWQEMDRAAFDYRTMQSAAKKAKDRDDLAEAIATVRMHYKQTPGGYRRGFILNLWNELERG